MASNLSPATPRFSSRPQKPSSFDFDRASPSSMKNGAAENSPSPRSGRSIRPAITEKRIAVSRGAELHQVQEELVKTKEQLALMEKSKSNLLHDLTRTKRQLEDIVAKLHESEELSKNYRLRAEEMEQARSTSEDWQVELDAMKQRYEAVVVELQKEKLTIENLRQELVMCGEAKDEAVMLAGEAMNAAESTARRVEELSVELLTAKGSLTEIESTPSKVTELMDELLAAQQCLAEATAAQINGEVLLAAKNTELKNIAEAAQVAEAEIDLLQHELSSSKLEISNLRYAMENLTVELKDAKSAHELALSSLEDVRVKYDKAAGELEKAVKSKVDALSSLERVRADYDRVDRDLEKAMKSEADAISSLVDIRADYATVAGELQKAVKSKADALVSVARLTGELTIANENFIRATVEGLAMEFMLEFLKNEVVKAQSYIQSLDASASTHFSSELEKLIEANQNEVMFLREREENAHALWKEREEATHAAVESLRSEVEDLKLEISKFEEREKSMKIAAFTLESDLNCLIEENSQQVMLLEMQERSTKMAMFIIQCELNHVMEENQKQVMLLEEKELNASAVIQSLNQERQSFKLEMAAVQQREILMNANFKALTDELDCTKKELLDLSEKHRNLSARLHRLEDEVKSSHLELAASKEREAGIATQMDVVMSDIKAKQEETAIMSEKVANMEGLHAKLLEDIKWKEMELVELRKEVANMDSFCGNFVMDLERKEMESAELKKKVTETDALQTNLLMDLERKDVVLIASRNILKSMMSKATVLCIVLATVTQASQHKHLALHEEVAFANRNVSKLDAELVKVKQDLQIALTTSKLASENVEKLSRFLAESAAENEALTKELQTAKAEAAQSKEESLNAMAKMQVTHDKAQQLIESVKASDCQAQACLLEANLLRNELKEVRKEAQLANEVVDALKKELSAAISDVESRSNDLEDARLVIVQLKKELELLQVKLEVQDNQSRGTMTEMEDLQDKLSRAYAKEEELQALLRNAEMHLQDALQELEIKNSETCRVAEEDNSGMVLDLETNEIQEKGTVIEMVATDNMNHALMQGVSYQEEIDCLKAKIRGMEDEFSVALKEVDAAKANNEKLCKELEEMRVEDETNKRVVLELHQHLADTEKAKSNMEAEIQRLLDGSKQWQISKNAIDIPIHSEMNGHGPNSRDEKPQPDSTTPSLRMDPIVPPKDEHVDESTLVDREELVHVEEETTMKDGIVSLQAKKKKKPLLRRLGTYLEKKKA